MADGLRSFNANFATLLRRMERVYRLSTSGAHRANERATHGQTTNGSPYAYCSQWPTAQCSAVTCKTFQVRADSGQPVR